MKNMNTELRISIRPAVPADLDSLTGLLRTLFAIEKDFFFEEEKQRRGLQLMLDHDRGCLLVAEAEGEVIVSPHRVYTRRSDKLQNCKALQGAGDTRHQPANYTSVCDQADNEVDSVSCEALQVIGMCSGQLLISTAEGGPVLLVEDVVVHRAWRNRGVGGRLLAAIETWAGGHKVSRLQLLADRHNQPALAFYRKKGWQATDLICLRQRRPF